jgi:hypothetical protein
MCGNFSPPVCSPTGEAGKNAETNFFQCSPTCQYRKQWVTKDKISIYIVKVNFSKIVASKGTTKFFKNMVAAHIEGSRPPPICLFETLFRVRVPLKTDLM